MHRGLITRYGGCAIGPPRAGKYVFFCTNSCGSRISQYDGMHPLQPGVAPAFQHFVALIAAIRPAGFHSQKVSRMCLEQMIHHGRIPKLRDTRLGCRPSASVRDADAQCQRAGSKTEGARAAVASWRRQLHGRAPTVRKKMELNDQAGPHDRCDEAHASRCAVMPDKPRTAFVARRRERPDRSLAMREQTLSTAYAMIGRSIRNICSLSVARHRAGTIICSGK